jgi:hypothetical protein
MDVHPTCEGEVTIHKCKKIHQLGGIAMGSKYLFSLCCPKKILVAHSIVLEKLLSDQFAQRDSTPARGGGGSPTRLHGALVAASMKGPRWLHRRAPDMGAAVAATAGSRRWQCALVDCSMATAACEGNKKWEVI